jgi:hypothetical protein
MPLLVALAMGQEINFEPDIKKTVCFELKKQWLLCRRCFYQYIY